ncbi:MAG: hypothetical protein GXX91_16810 [Verrucomicrobiaceae bacterium]|nr:hypothetical protein [Verrucomicrobiaceae bacterium]
MKLVLAVVGLCVWLGAAGCGAPNDEVPTKREEPVPDEVREALHDSVHMALSTNHMKMLLLTMFSYKDEKGQWPDKLEELKGNPDLDFAKVIKNPVTGDDPGYEYVKPTGDDPRTIILYQLSNGKRDTTLPVGHADGSVSQ